MNIFLKNNITAIAIHICVGLVLLYPYILIDNRSNGRLGAFTCIAIGICTILAFFLYFLAGRQFLSHTSNLIANAFSVAVVAIILIIVVCIRGNTLSFMANLPLYPLGGLVSHYLRLKEECVFAVTAMLPSMFMWIGMISKRSP